MIFQLTNLQRPNFIVKIKSPRDKKDYDKFKSLQKRVRGDNNLRGKGKLSLKYMTRTQHNRVLCTSAQSGKKSDCVPIGIGILSLGWISEHQDIQSNTTMEKKLKCCILDLLNIVTSDGNFF